jgi:hypothetical protein
MRKDASRSHKDPVSASRSTGRRSSASECTSPVSTAK